MRCSVVIPLHNKAAYIGDALGSVLSQSYPPFEVIVVDDGSTDGAGEFVRAVTDTRVRYVRQARAGVSAARNHGIDLAGGDLVSFLDADDWYLPRFLETVVAMARAHPDIGFFGTGYRRVRADRARERAAETASLQQLTDDIEIVRNPFRRWIGRPMICTDSVAVRRDLLVLMQPCFPVGESLGEDLDLWFSLAERSALAYAPAVLACYRVGHPGSVTDASPPPTELLPSVRRLEQRARSEGYPQGLRSAAMRYVAEARIATARQLLVAGRRREAAGQWIQAWRAVGSVQWWATAVLLSVAPSGAVRRWQDWRERVARQP